MAAGRSAWGAASWCVIGSRSPPGPPARFAAAARARPRSPRAARGPPACAARISGRDCSPRRLPDAVRQHRRGLLVIRQRGHDGDAQGPGDLPAASASPHPPGASPGGEPPSRSASISTRALASPTWRSDGRSTRATTARRGQHRLAGRPGVEPAAVGDDVQRLRREHGGQRRPGRARARCPGAGRTSRRAAACPVRRPARSAAATAPRRRRPGSARPSKASAEQPRSGGQVPGEQPGQDVAAAGVAFGQDHLPGPAQGQRQRRGGHAGRPAGARPARTGSRRGSGWVTTRAIWPVAACSATTGPSLAATSRSTTSNPSWSGTVFTACDHRGERAG